MVEGYLKTTGTNPECDNKSQQTHTGYKNVDNMT